MMRIGFLGCAHVHAPVYRDEVARRAPIAAPTAVYDHDTPRAQAFAAAAGLAVAETPADLCAAVDAVIVTAEHVFYAELVAVAAAAGKPILCEKPLGVSFETAKMILASDAWLSVAFPVRYAPAVRQARETIRAGTLGRLLAMSGANHAPFPGGFFGSRHLAGGGAIIDHVVHLADALRWMTGCEYASVFAEASDVLQVGDVDDVAQVVATTTDGAWVSIDPSWSRPAGMAGGNDFLMEMWFEHGRVAIDAFAAHGTFVGSNGRASHLPYGPSIDADLVGDWLSAISDGRPPPITALDGWRATELALSALQSASTGTVVSLQAAERST